MKRLKPTKVASAAQSGMLPRFTHSRSRLIRELSEFTYDYRRVQLHRGFAGSPVAPPSQVAPVLQN
jgi:hypothetical protein